MVQRARDARLLRALLHLDPPRGLTRATWRRYLEAQVAPVVRQVVRDLGQPLDGPVATTEDLDERAHAGHVERARQPRERKRRAVSIRESLARAIERADPTLGDTLDERVDSLLVLALTTHPGVRGRPA